MELYLYFTIYLHAVVLNYADLLLYGLPLLMIEIASNDRMFND